MNTPPPSYWQGVPESGIAEVLWRRPGDALVRRAWPTRRGDDFVPVTLVEVQDGSRPHSLPKPQLTAVMGTRRTPWFGILILGWVLYGISLAVPAVVADDPFGSDIFAGLEAAGYATTGFFLD